MSMEGEEFVHVNQARTDRFSIAVLDLCYVIRWQVYWDIVIYFSVYNSVLFSNWGTPSLNTFINEMNVFQ